MELRYTFDPERFYLGTLCKHGHRWPGTDLSLRRVYKSPSGITVNHCIACTGRKQSDWLISFVDAQAMGLPDGFKFGKLCKSGHLWNGLKITLRNRQGKCLDCEKARKQSEQCKIRSRLRYALNADEIRRKAREKSKERLATDPEYAEHRRMYRRERKRKIAAALREQGLTTRGTLPIRADGLAPKGQSSQLGEYFKAISNAGRCPTVADLVEAEHRRYLGEHPEAKLEADRARRRENHRLRYLIDPDYRLYHRQKSKRRKAQMRDSVAIQLSGKQVRARFAQFDHRCAYCGTGGELHIEHVVPISKGGTHALGNVVPACESCNYSKTTHEVESWYRSQPFFSELRWRKICRVLGWDRSAVGQLALL